MASLGGRSSELVVVAPESSSLGADSSDVVGNKEEAEQTEQEKEKEQEEEEDEDPSLSSAAQCIRFLLHGCCDGDDNNNNNNNSNDDGGGASAEGGTDTFGPTYLHQIFPGERIRGYQPPLYRQQEMMMTAKPTTNNNNSRGKQIRKLHSSYYRDGIHSSSDTLPELDVRVSLSPSCRYSRIDINIVKTQPQQKQKQQQQQQPPTNTRKRAAAASSSSNKRQRKDDEEDQDENNQQQLLLRASTTSSTTDNDDEEYYDAVGGSEYEEEDSNYQETKEEVSSTISHPTTTTASCDGVDGGSSSTNSRSSMPIDTIRSRIAQFVPQLAQAPAAGGTNNSTTCNNGNDLMGDYLNEPIGTVFMEYSRKEQHYCLAMANGTDDAVPAYHQQVQKLAVFFIETANDVDVSRTKDGKWRVLYLFRRHQRHNNSNPNNSNFKYSLVGYVTLFAFAAPFHKPKAGTVLRICQALLLPPYQRAGHGRRMLHAVYNYFGGSSVTNDDSRNGGKKRSVAVIDNDDNGDGDDEVVEINVEDPAPAFVALRNCVDYERFVRLAREEEEKEEWCWKRNGDDVAVTEPNWFVPLSESQALQAAAYMKTTTKQVHLIYEMDRLRQLDLYKKRQRQQRKKKKAAVVDDTEELDKRYRLMVKKRLNKMHREEMCGCRNKKEMQDFLSKLYDESFDHYRRILASVHKQQDQEGNDK